jgi:hypothetical protein
MPARERPAHGGYPGEVRLAPCVVQIVPGLEMADGRERCTECGGRMRQEDNPTGGDSWYYRCPRGHEAWVGK